MWPRATHVCLVVHLDGEVPRHVGANYCCTVLEPTLAPVAPVFVGKISPGFRVAFNKMYNGPETSPSHVDLQRFGRPGGGGGGGRSRGCRGGAVLGYFLRKSTQLSNLARATAGVSLRGKLLVQVPA
jgi:hypothetical protein